MEKEPNSDEEPVRSYPGYFASCRAKVSKFSHAFPECLITPPRHCPYRLGLAGGTFVIIQTARQSSKRPASNVNGLDANPGRNLRKGGCAENKSR